MTNNDIREQMPIPGNHRESSETIYFFFQLKQGTGNIMLCKSRGTCRRGPKKGYHSKDHLIAM